jgi:hypothetical protein
MKEYRKLGLRKFKVAKLVNSFSLKGGALTYNTGCGPLTTNMNDCITIGQNSCLNGGCNNQSYEFETCNCQGTLETRTGDSLGKPSDIM